MAKKSKKESLKIQENTSVEALKIEEAPKTEDKFFIKPACRCITPFGTFEAGSFVAVDKKTLDHFEKHGLKFERAN